MDKGKINKYLMVAVFLVIVIVSLFLAYQNGVIGKAIVQGIGG